MEYYSIENNSMNFGKFFVYLIYPQMGEDMCVCVCIVHDFEVDCWWIDRSSIFIGANASLSLSRNAPHWILNEGMHNICTYSYVLHCIRFGEMWSNHTLTSQRENSAIEINICMRTRMSGRQARASSICWVFSQQQHKITIFVLNCAVVRPLVNSDG